MLRNGFFVWLTFIILLGWLPLALPLQASSRPWQPDILETETAKWLHSKLWGKNFNLILEQVYDGLEKYISQAMVIHLQLDKLGFHEKALLVREEYVTALNMLEGPFQHSSGIIITGNPGIGGSSFTIRIIFL